MRSAPRVRAGGTHQGGSAAGLSHFTVAISAVGAILLARMFYFVSELLVVLAALAGFFLVVMGFLILFLLAQECGRWSARKFNEAKQVAALSMGVGVQKLALRKPIGGSREV